MENIFVVLSCFCLVFGIFEKVGAHVKLKENKEHSQKAIIKVPNKKCNSCVKGHKSIVLEGEFIVENLHI